MTSVIQSNQNDHLLRRLWRQIAIDGQSGCWVWTGTRSTDHMHYGQVSVNNRAQKVHRLMYTLMVGPIPTGLCVLHKCDNPPCCNPDHLFTGTNEDNTNDRHTKGRSARGSASGRHTKPERTARGSRNGRSKLTESKVATIRDRYATGNVFLKTLAKEYNVSTQVVWRIVRGISWKTFEDKTSPTKRTQ